MHKSQIFLILLCAFLIGVLSASFITLSQEYIYGFLALGVVVLGASAYQRTFGTSAAGTYRRTIGFLLGAGILAFSGGLLRYQHFDAGHSIMTKFNDLVVGGQPLSVTVRGYVDGDIRERGSTIQFPLRVKEILVPGRRVFADERILVTAPTETYRYGDFLRVSGAPQAPRNTGDFDYVLYLKKQGVRTTLQTTAVVREENPPLIGVLERSRVSVYRALTSLSSSFISGLHRALPEPHASYVAGILVGARQTIPEDLRDAFARTGTSHILALSGYNITIIAEALMVILLYAFYRRKAFWWTVLGITLFTIMTGASASVVRAAVMGILLLAANGYGRLYDVRIAIVLAAALMVLLNPFVLVFDVGFQLSFIAVAGLIYIYPLLKRWARTIPETGNLKEILLMTLAAQIATLPLLVGYFNTISLVALLVNILILPFVPIVMFFGFLAGVVGMLWEPLARLVGVVAWALAEYQLAVVRWFSAQSFAAIDITVSWWALLLIYTAGIAGIFFLRRKHDVI